MPQGFQEFLNVPLDGLAGFWKETLSISLIADPPPEGFLNVPIEASYALVPRSVDIAVGPLPEGVYVANVIARRFEEFQEALDDLRHGLQYCGDAAVVLAEAYRGVDDLSAIGIGDVAFVFGDQGARPPSGFRDDYETHSDQRSNYDTVVEREVVGPDMIRTTTTVTDADGNVVSVLVETSYPTTYVPGLSSWTKREETVHGPDGSVTVTTETKQHSDGTVEVTTTRPGPDGEPETTTRTVTPQDQPAAGGTPAPEPAGPIETAVEELELEVNPRHTEDIVFEQYVERDEHGFLRTESGGRVY